MHLSRGEYEAFASYNKDGKKQSMFFFPVSGRELHSLRIFQQRQSNGWGRERHGSKCCCGRTQSSERPAQRGWMWPRCAPFAWLQGWEAADPPFPVFHWGCEGFTPHTLHRVTLWAWARTGLVSRELMGKQGMNMQTGKSMRPVSSGLCWRNVWDRNCPAGSSLGASLTSIL